MDKSAEPNAPMELCQALQNIQKINMPFARDEIICIRQHKDEAIPELLEIVALSIAEHKKLQGEWHEGLKYHFYAMYLLAEFGAREAFPLFAEILELDIRVSDIIIGDLLTESMGSLLASVAGESDIDLIKAIVENTVLDPYQRGAAINALIVLCVRGIYSRYDLIAYLGYLFEAYRGDPEFLGIVGNSCYDISAKEHYPIILDMYYEIGMDDSFGTKETFIKENPILTNEEVLANLSKEPLFMPITDTIDSMSWWAGFKREDYYESEEQKNYRISFINAVKNSIFGTFDNEADKVSVETPLATGKQYGNQPIVKGAKIGRNAPCPCGSGKKYKKCCLE